MPKLRTCPAMLLVTFLFCTVIGSSAQSAVFSSLASFNGTDGANPGHVSLVRGTDGNFYGTAAGGGANNYGTVFKITPAGTLTTLYSFCSQPNCSDGGYPEAALLLASDGNFYGTTSWGGENGPAYIGTVFKITPAGELTTLYSFCSQHDCLDGRSPSTSLVQGTDGNFYGTTPVAGAGCYIWGCGTVFQITPAGTLTTLYSFNEYDGDGPNGLVQGSDGNFYGTTSLGGTYYSGVVFTITPSGVLNTLYSFCSQPNCTDGALPESSLVQAVDGNFYGTTYGGGMYQHGTVFKTSGGVTTLHSFDGSDGSKPYAGLVQTRDGNLYGTTSEGGADSDCDDGCGTVFKMTPSGTLTTLHSFDGSDGELPYGGLLQAPNGMFYGTTSAGGAYQDGTVFRLAVVRPCATCLP